MAKIVNLTPHAIVLMAENETITIKPSGIIARCATTREQVDSIEIDGVVFPVNQIGFGAVQGLPDPQDGVCYVVSSLVANAAKGRSDLLTVDDAVRDGAGNIVGARALARTC
jgi:hypothetical protein